MRILLALALGGLAGFLIWHGITSDAPAQAEYELGSKVTPKNFKELHRRFPYSSAAVQARQDTLESQIAAHAGSSATPGKVPTKEDLKAVAMKIPDETKAGISSETPFVQPYTAAILGVIGLLLALILPGTRFRGLAFLGLLIGTACALAGMLPEENQVGLVDKVSMSKYVIANFPRVALGCLALAALTLLVHVRRTRSAL
jgi:hypothetical protein